MPGCPGYSGTGLLLTGSTSPPRVLCVGFKSLDSSEGFRIPFLGSFDGKNGIVSPLSMHPFLGAFGLTFPFLGFFKVSRFW